MSMTYTTLTLKVAYLLGIRYVALPPSLLSQRG